ncbi:MAG: hypothetical protein GX121_08680 [Ignavibacteria bacterium]|nr:hypothetical protein [Ignavibacteria bacterium]
MKAKNKVLFLLLIVVLFSAIYLACTNEEKAIEKSSISVFCDESIYNILIEPFSEFNAHFKEIETNKEQATSWEVMAKLLTGEAPIIFTSRDFTQREDSLMKEHNVESIKKFPIANDALVFFTQLSTPLDTLTDEQIVSCLTNEVPLASFYKKLSEEPTFVINNEHSSEYENLLNLTVKYKNIKRKLVFLNSTDSVKEYVKTHENSIGIGYLSHLLSEPELKSLPISFVNEKGKYIFPRTVHQANIIQKLYPYIVTHYVMTFDGENTNANSIVNFFRFGSGIVQKYFNRIGIVPAVAKVNLVQ